MRTLITEDDYITSQVMQEIMLNFGKCDIADDGMKAINLFRQAIEENEYYDLIFLDIMMPEMDGQETLEQIRSIEARHGIKGLEGVKIIMTTALDDFDNIINAFKNQCDGYIVKPIEKDKVINAVAKLGLLE